MMINPINHPVIVEGPLYHHHSNKCYNCFRFRKKLIDVFPQLRTSNKVYYRAEACKSYEGVNSRIKEIIKKKEGIPLLIFFYAEEG